MTTYPRAADLMAHLEHCSGCAETNPEADADGESECCGRRVCRPDGTAQDVCCSAVQAKLDAESAEAQVPAAPAPARPAGRQRKARRSAQKGDATRGLQSGNGHANLVSHRGGEPHQDRPKEPDMAVPRYISAGARVRTVDGITGVISKEPFLMPSGWSVTVAYDAEFAHLSPVGGATYSLADLERDEPTAAERSAAAEERAESRDREFKESGLGKLVAKRQAGAQPAKAARRAALGASSAEGWELLYDKPKQGCEVGRRTVDGKAAYALICKEHKHVHPVPRLTSERPVRAAGGWCPDCK